MAVFVQVRFTLNGCCFLLLDNCCLICALGCSFVVIGEITANIQDNCLNPLLHTFCHDACAWQATESTIKLN